MNLTELIREWPQWRGAGAETIISSPAFCVEASYNGVALEMRPASCALEDTIDLSISFDGEPTVLSSADSQEFHDLHLLWQNRAALPPALLLALVEKECGGLLQAVENMAQQQLSVSGLAEQAEAGALARRRYDFQLGDMSFGLGLTPHLLVSLGKFDNLDFTHASIRSLPRKVMAEYASFAIAEPELAALTANDVLLLPDDFLSMASWHTLDSDNEGTLLMSPEETELTFANFADGDFPPVPEPSRLLLWHGGKAIAEGSISAIGERICFRLTHLL